MATTSTAWDVTTDPKKPVAEFDKDAVRDIPLDWTEFFTDIGSTYKSHTITVSPELECIASVETAGVVQARIRCKPEAAVGKKYFVRCHMIAQDDQEDDQTVFLKIVQK